MTDSTESDGCGSALAATKDATSPIGEPGVGSAPRAKTQDAVGVVDGDFDGDKDTVGVVVCVPEGVALADGLEPRLSEAVGVPVPDSGVVVGVADAVADGVVVAVSVVVVDLVGDVDEVCEGVSEGVTDELGLVPVDIDAVGDEDEESEMEPVEVIVGVGLCVRVGVCETDGVGVGVGVGEAVRVCVGVSDAAADCDVAPEN